MSEIKTKFYRFRQNNSGGSFDVDDERGIGVYVWVEACDIVHARSRAEGIGIYFDGVADGVDCECCGDRWSAPWDDEGMPSCKINEEYDFDWCDTVYLHRLDGSIERFRKGQILTPVALLE